jgi:hypothetical protein
MEVSPVPTQWTTSRMSQLLGYIRTIRDMEHRPARHDPESTLGLTYKTSRLRTSIHTNRPRRRNIHEHPTWLPRGRRDVKIQHGPSHRS